MKRDVEFRNARMYTRAFLTKCDNSWGGIMQVVRKRDVASE